MRAITTRCRWPLQFAARNHPTTPFTPTTPTHSPPRSLHTGLLHPRPGPPPSLHPFPPSHHPPSLHSPPTPRTSNCITQTCPATATLTYTTPLAAGTHPPSRPHPDPTPSSPRRPLSLVSPHAPPPHLVRLHTPSLSPPGPPTASDATLPTPHYSRHSTLASSRTGHALAAPPSPTCTPDLATTALLIHPYISTHSATPRAAHYPTTSLSLTTRRLSTRTRRPPPPHTPSHNHASIAPHSTTSTTPSPTTAPPRLSFGSATHPALPSLTNSTLAPKQPSLAPSIQTPRLSDSPVSRRPTHHHSPLPHLPSTPHRADLSNPRPTITLPVPTQPLLPSVPRPPHAPLWPLDDPIQNNP